MSTSSPNTAPQGEPTTPLSAERLAEIRERAAAATPGPWCTDGWEIYQGTEYLAGAVWIGETCDTSDTAKSVADAEFIGHAREDVPALLAEIDRLRGEAKRALKPNVERALIKAAVGEALVEHHGAVDLATKVTDSVVATFNEVRGESR